MAPDQIHMLQALATLAVACFVLAYLSSVGYRWQRERHEYQRSVKLAELRALAAALAAKKGQGVEA